MIMSGLDFGLIISLSYLLGLGSGISIICKYKEKIMIVSRSRDNISSMIQNDLNQTPVIASAPAPNVTKITLE
tara:strand:+ start:1418 stop:1636 length:219 start_codon:yes stop_codon:yes gene_type:complete